MRNFKEKSLTDRLTDKAAAKQALIRKMQARPGPDDPSVLARAAQRKAIAEAREVRLAAKAAAAEQAAIEQAARDAAAEAERIRAAEEAALAEQARLDAEVALEADRKRARDLRYAARKAAKKR
ncbi:MAG: DUF6481 family protein [Hyphomicrobiaceae bacterium]